MSDFKTGDRVLIEARVGICRRVPTTEEIGPLDFIPTGNVIPIRGPFWLAREQDYQPDRVWVSTKEPHKSKVDGIFYAIWDASILVPFCETLFGFCPAPGKCIKIEGGWRPVEEANDAQ